MPRRISSGESSHPEAMPDGAAAKQTIGDEKPKKVFDPSLEPAKWLGQRGGKNGGKTRSASMTPEERSELAKKAAAARWAATQKSKE